MVTIEWLSAVGQHSFLVLHAATCQSVCLGPISGVSRMLPLMNSWPAFSAHLIVLRKFEDSCESDISDLQTLDCDKHTRGHFHI